MYKAKTRITHPLTLLAVMALLLMMALPPMLNGVRAAKTEARVTASSRTSEPALMQAATSGCTGVSFSQPKDSPFGVGTTPASVAVGDFNQDGKADLATANFGSNNVTIELGDGSGSFSQAAGSPVGVGMGPQAVAVGDFNQDGKADLATANVSSNDVDILLGNGSGGFTQAAGSPFGVGTAPISIVVGDFNQDGKLDLATANIDSHDVTLLLGNGSGGFTQAAGSPVGVGSFPDAVAVGDFNQDGKPDLATANSDSDNVTILLGDGSGGFTQAAGSPFGVGDFPNSITVGDFNLDGKADLATANVSSVNVTILLGNGSGGFTQPAGSPLGVGISPAAVAVGDFNQDGKADIVTANIGSNNATILLGNGSGGFTQAAGSPVSVGASPQFVAVGDFNQDGKADLATANPDSNNVTIQLNTCDALPCGNTSFAQPTGSPLGVGTNPHSVAIGDFNRDGKADLATANSGSNNVSILLGNGSGDFTQPVGSPLGVGTIPVSVSVGDFNQDGKADLATANSFSGTVSILLGDGSGGFAQVADSPFGVGDSPISIAVGDFNQDGKADLATANTNPSTVSILLGDGSGGFAQVAGSPFAVGTFPQSITIGDFNQDGKADLATPNAGSDTVTILLGDGSGGFTQAAGSPFGAGNEPRSIAVGDFNQDGKADLAAANFTSTVTILLGNGSGGFTQATGSPFSAAGFPISVVVGDFNLDGKADLATAGLTANIVDILLGNGSGGFAQAAGSPFGVGSLPQFVAVADFNRDGKTDLATANTISNNVTILLNTCTPNSPPTITGSPVSRNAGGSSANSQIATVGDLEDAEDLLTITVNSSASATVNNVTVNGISVSAAGVVTADVVAACNAATANFTLRVTDSGDLFNEATLTVTVNPDNQPPTITCPANLTQNTDLNLCSALVTYALPKVSDNCPGLGAPVCTPPSASTFAKGTTTVTCTVNDASKNQSACSFTVTVNDTQAPSITCPVNQTRVLVRPTDTTVVVTYPAPTFSDNCAGASVACLPPSGSAFPVGTTTVTCTATDASGNTATCSFTVTVFDVCLQDDSSAETVLLFNSFTGHYRFCCRGTIFAGKGTVQKLGSSYTLTHNAADRRVTAKLEGALNRGTASLQSPVGTLRCAISDRDTRNNTCACATSVQ